MAITIYWVIRSISCGRKERKMKDLLDEFHAAKTQHVGMLKIGYETTADCQPVRLLVNDRKFLAENSVFLSHQISQQ